MNGTNGNEPGYPENALVPYPVIVAATKGRPAFFALRPGRSAKLRVSPMYGTEGAQGVR